MTALNKFLEVHGKKYGAAQAIANEVFEDDYAATYYSKVAVYAIKHAMKGCFVVAYENSAGQYIAEFWRSSSVKKPVSYRFKSKENRLAYANKWIANEQRIEADKIATRAKRKAQGTGLEVGDILSAVWGYEQTNYNYYEVTKVIGKAMVEIREVKQMIQETEWMQGKCAPQSGEYIGEPMRRKATNGSLKVSDCIYASKMDYTEVAGARIYNAGHYTSYH